MNGPPKTTTNLIKELEALRARVAELETETADLKHAEEALREGEARYRSFLQNFQGIAFRGDMKFTPIFFHGAVEKITGYTEEEFTAGKPRWDQVIHPDDLSAVYEAAHKAMATPGRSGDLEHRIVRKDGQIRWVRELVQTVADESGQSIFAQGVIYDVTERRRAEEEARRSELELSIRNRIADIFLTMPDEKMYGEVLQVVLETMESKYGVFGYVDEDATLVCPSMTRDVWDECQIPDKNIVFPRKTWGGVWGRALAEKKTFYSNEPYRVPEGHIPMLRSMAVPIMHGGQVIGLLHVANKATDYDEKDRRLMETIARHIGPVLHARLQRDEQYEEIKRVEEALRESRDKLEKRVEERTAELARANEELRKEMAERGRAEHALQEKNTLLEALIEAIPDAVYFKDLQGRNLVVNEAFEMLVGLSRKEILGKTDEYVLPPELAEQSRQTDEQVVHSGVPLRVEQQSRGLKGETLVFDTVKSPILDDVANVKGLVGVSRDITERKRAEEQVEASLREKELLLKEIQHRVKNNLQLISSLFDLESRATYDERMISLLKESRNRVRSIALIHEGLYEAKDLTSIDFAEYVKSLVSHLFRSFGVGDTDIALKVDVGDLRMSVGVAIPCALIVNELVSNSLKHAFQAVDRGEIRIALSLNDANFSLTVSDNGVGLPESLELRDTASLGLRLVRTLAHQLKGTVELDGDAGTTFIITFPRSIG
jgi:PAS domain S-box-containing protein